MIGAIALVALLLIAGSGGGGGGGAAGSSNTSASNNPGWKKLSDTEANDQTSVKSFETDEYRKNPILSSVYASKAYAELKKNGIDNIAGSGVNVGVGVANKQGPSAIVNGANLRHSLITGTASNDHYVFSSASATLTNGLKTLDGIQASTVDVNGNYICSGNSCFYNASISDATTNNVLNSINIIAGIKSSSPSSLSTDTHGIAYNSKISEVFNIYSQSSGQPRVYYGSDGQSSTTTSVGIQSFNASSLLSTNGKSYFKIYNYIEHYEIPAGQSISEKNKSDFRNITAQAKTNDVLIVLSSGGPKIAGNLDYYSQISKAFSASESAEANSNIIFVTPLYNDAGLYKALPMYDGTLLLFNNCGQSNQTYCLGVNVGGLSSYKYLSNNDQSYDGGKFTASVGGNDYVENMNIAQSAVSGAAAVLAGAWPQLSSSAIRDILFESADKPDDFGAYGSVSNLDNGAKTHTIYGRGILNLYKAVNSYGTKSLSTGSSALNASQYTLDDTSFRTSPIFGDAFSSNVAPQVDQAIYYDKYGRDFKAFLGDKFSNTTQTNSFSLNNFAFNNIKNNSKSIGFGESNDFQLKFNQTQFKDQDAQNNLGLKYAVIDRAINQQANLNNNSGFAFNFNPQAFDKKLSVGFAHNVNEIDNQDAKNYGTSGFLNQGTSFNSNPYQSFLNSSNNLTNTSQNNLSTRKFNQLFASQEVIDDKVDIKFSYQSSFNTTSANFVSTGNKQNEVLNFGIDLKPNESNKISISTGELREFDNNALNSKASGAFTSQNNARTSYAKITASQNIVDHLNLTSTYAQGITHLKGNDQGIFQKYSDIHSQSLSFALQYDGIEDNRFGVAYSEPMRVYKGSVNYKIPVDIDSNMNLIHKEGVASLAPKGKQRDYEFFYEKNLNKNSQLRLNLMMQRELNNIKSNANNYVGYISVNSSF